MKYSWPGNVRELENVLYEAMVLAEKEIIDVNNLPLRITGIEEEMDMNFDFNKSLNQIIESITEKIEKRMIQKALQECRGNRINAAKRLGISRKTLFNKMKRYNLL